MSSKHIHSRIRWSPLAFGEVVCHVKFRPKTLKIGGQMSDDLKKKSSDKVPEHLKHLFERRAKKPHYVRTKDYLRFYGSNYIVRRNEFSSIVYIVGKAYRKLSTNIDVQHALKMGKKVAQWGNKFFLYTRVDVDSARMLLVDMWKEDVKRGIPKPEVSDYDKETFDI